VGAPVYRIFRARRSPWWFSSDGAGRFDLPVPRGTCYLADDPLAALLEVTRGLTLLSESFLSGRRLLTGWPARSLRLADLTAAAAYRYGVTAELSAGADYTGPRAWAAALADTGFDGLRYRIRHDPRAELSGVAWFGRAGRPDHPPASHHQPLPASLLLAAAPFGIRVAADLPEPE
jgi:RES domain-containing protein